MKRFRVAENSMLPALAPGEEIIATDSRAPAPGDIVLFTHPDRPDFWLVKRAVEPPQPIGAGEIWALSDNPEVTTADSRSFGPVSRAKTLTRVTRLDEGFFGEACDLLASEDPALSAALEAFGLPDFWSRSPGFAPLVLLILEQQVSLESGAAMYRRIAELESPVTPASIIRTGETALRSVGVTRQKAGYLVGLAEAVASGELDIDALGDLPPDEARDRLTSLKGIGPWTADAYLLSALRHIDMWPVGDRALQVGAGEVLGMSSTPTADELEIIGEPWRPLRAAAARIIWHAYLTSRGREEPPDPLGT